MEHKRELKLAEWDDQDVQRIYEILCDPLPERPSEEHWESYCARWIVGEVFAKVKADLKEAQERHIRFMVQGGPVVMASDYDELRADNKALLDALKESAQSLRTLATMAGKDEMLREYYDIRGYANSRANVAEAALAEHSEPQ